MSSLAVKYRPQTFEDIKGQLVTVEILKKQLETGKISNTYLFAGPSGDGKTTTARILARAINGTDEGTIEIDAASNNGVDNIRNIIKAAKEKSLCSEYKIFIIDEAHALTSQSFQALLKLIEEPPKYTIFIFCTTDPQKLPATISGGRVQRFNFSKVSIKDIYLRLEYICKQEGFINYEQGIYTIAKLSNGGMRDAISMLEKCSLYSKEITYTNVIKCIGNFSYDYFLTLTEALIDNNDKQVITIINELDFQGINLKMFIDEYLKFCIELTKYSLFNDINDTNLPEELSEAIKNICSFDRANEYYLYIADKLLELNNVLKNEIDIKSTCLIMLLQISRCKK